MLESGCRSPWTHTAGTAIPFAGKSSALNFGPRDLIDAAEQYLHELNYGTY